MILVKADGLPSQGKRIPRHGNFVAVIVPWRAVQAGSSTGLASPSAQSEFGFRLDEINFPIRSFHRFTSETSREDALTFDATASRSSLVQ